MRDLLPFAIAGFAASLVDGALGMGFGPTSSSILLTSGLAPAAVSTSVNLAKVASGVAAGISHWRFRNIDRRLVIRLAVPGSVGAIVGVTVLSNVNGATLKPLLALLLTLIGVRILFRFSRKLASDKSAPDASEDPNSGAGPTPRGVKVAAFLGGITNGMIGAWGPVVTPFLLHRGVRPRYAIGSVNTAEIAVASVSAFSLLASMGSGGFRISIVVAMLVGGVIAAPVAAWLTRFIPARPMGVAVAGLLLFTNARELAIWSGLAWGPWLWAFYSGLLAMVTLALIAPRLRTTSSPTP